VIKQVNTSAPQNFQQSEKYQMRKSSYRQSLRDPQ
jgi:hypothetical protein